MRLILAIATLAALAASATAAVTKTTTHDTSATGLNGQIAVGDSISGLIATELPGDLGWHPAVSDPLDKLPAFTDDSGIRATNLTGLLNDLNPPATPVGVPVKRVQYDLSGPTSLAEIRVLSGNNLNSDGRVFSTFTVSTSTNNGGAFSLLGYFESDPLGTINSGGTNGWKSTLVSLKDNAGPLASGVTNLQFDFYSVDNTGGQYRDPFDGVNPFTSIDDGLTAAFVSPLVWEIDVIAVPEPASAMLVLMGVVGLASLRKR
ncbi:MAG: PEP-CTERM sorting domain-containing protein [Pirellulales bacterium]